MKLTQQQKKFADLYISSGNAKQSYINAGYKARNNVAEANASRLLRHAKVRKYIEERNKQLESTRISDMKEVKEFWSSIMRNNKNEIKDRLKASEYIAKTNGAFLDKVEHTGEVNVNKKVTKNELKEILEDDEDEE